MSLTENISTLFLVYFFKRLIWNQLYNVTATVVAPFSSENGQLLLLFNFIDTLIQLWCYIDLIHLFLLSMVSANTVSTVFIAITENKVSFCCFGAKVVPVIWHILSFQKHEVVVRVLLIIFLEYILFYYQGSDLKLSLRWQCNRLR